MTRVGDLVHKAVEDGRPLLSMTDHGNMAATVQLYKETKKAGIGCSPGFEAYLCDPRAEDPMHGDTKRYHLLLNALNYEGYKALVRLNNLAHSRPRFNRFPRITWEDLLNLGRESGENVTISTGCFFGYVQQLINSGELKRAEAFVRTIAKVFPHTIVEVQHHNITHDDDPGGLDDTQIVRELFSIADTLGLPVLATQDSHYTDSRQKGAHSLMKRMVYSSVEDGFPGDSFHLAGWEWVSSHYTGEQWDRIEESAQHILSLNTMTFPALDKFTARVPVIEQDAQAKLTKRCLRLLRDLCGDDTGSVYKKYRVRLVSELETISAVGMANYFLLVLRVIQWCADNGVAVEARGSANGSLVCYLLGITQVDPVAWRIPFERFLSKDRIKPPDIDLDVEKSRRQELIAWLREQYPTMSIGTWSQLGITIDPETGEERGSVMTTYQTYLRRTAERLAEEHLEKKGHAYTKNDLTDLAARIFTKRFRDIRELDDVKAYSATDYKYLRQIDAMKSVYRSYGVHAAGVLLGTDDFNIGEHVPGMLIASSDTFATQYAMDDIDELGLLKLDVLGQAVLTTMRVCVENIKVNDTDGEFDEIDACDFSWIPDDDAKACAILRSGEGTSTIFHFEGYTKRKGGRELGIKSTADAVLATAIYMPGATDGGAKDEYLRRRAAREFPLFHPIFDRVLKETRGVMVYQDQPLSILREMGMDIASVNLLYKVLKDSGRGAVERNKERLETLRKEFDYLCAKHGIPNDEAWAMVTSFNAYGMNKAHAAGYGIRSYRCAYLKAHYPFEWMSAVLSVWASVAEKVKLYEREARRLGFRLQPPDVNHSDVTHSMGRRGVIRRGLVTIKGVGYAVAEAIAANQPYTNIDDLVARARPSGRVLSGGKEWEANRKLSGVLLALDNASALDVLK